MALTPSMMVPLATPAPDFTLPDTDGRNVKRSDFAGKPLLVMFLCNHCPYVQHVRHHIAGLTAAYAKKGVAVVGISSNDVQAYPDDGPALMKKEKLDIGYTFPYLFDESQAVAHAYHAACTPDFFLYDTQHRLVYRGQYDDSRPSNGKPVTGADLSAAVEALLSGKPPVSTQQPSVGCNIKWKPGNAPPIRLG